MKVCKKCGRELPYTEEFFYKSNKTKSGLRSECKDCFKKRSKEHKDNNNEYYTNYLKSYRSNNKDRISQYHSKYQEINKEQHRIHSKKYADNNSDKIREYRNKNKDYIKIYLRKYRKSERGKMAAFRGRTKRRSTENTIIEKGIISSEEWSNCKNYFDNCCCYCGKPMKRVEREHFTPISKGGESNVTNILPSCRSCNSSKNNSDFYKWYSSRKDIFSIQRLEKIYTYMKIVSKKNIANK